MVNEWWMNGEKDTLDTRAKAGQKAGENVAAYYYCQRLKKKKKLQRLPVNRDLRWIRGLFTTKIRAKYLIYKIYISNIYLGPFPNLKVA